MEVYSKKLTSLGRADVVVVGSGIAGLSVALRATCSRVALLTDAAIGLGSASAQAQGQPERQWRPVRADQGRRDRCLEDRRGGTG